MPRQPFWLKRCLLNTTATGFQILEIMFEFTDSDHEYDSSRLARDSPSSPEEMQWRNEQGELHHPQPAEQRSADIEDSTDSGDSTDIEDLTVTHVGLRYWHYGRGLSLHDAQLFVQFDGAIGEIAHAENSLHIIESLGLGTLLPKRKQLSYHGAVRCLENEPAHYACPKTGQGYVDLGNNVYTCVFEVLLLSFSRSHPLAALSGEHTGAHSKKYLSKRGDLIEAVLGLFYEEQMQQIGLVGPPTYQYEKIATSIEVSCRMVSVLQAHLGWLAPRDFAHFCM
jgi:hypothetical protein